MDYTVIGRKWSVSLFNEIDKRTGLTKLDCEKKKFNITYI